MKIFDATYSDFRLIKTRGVVQIVLEVPLHLGNHVLGCLGLPNPAAEQWVRVSTIVDQQQETKNPANTSSDDCSAEQPARQNPYSRRAGILSTDPLFQRYASADTIEQAASFIRLKCKVTSRRDILPNTEAATRFDLLESAFVCWRDGPRVGAA